MVKHVRSHGRCHRATHIVLAHTRPNGRSLIRRPSPVACPILAVLSRFLFTHVVSIRDSPYPEVRAAVSNTDDPTMPVNTFRVYVSSFSDEIAVHGSHCRWLLGMLVSAIIPAFNTVIMLRCTSFLHLFALTMLNFAQSPLSRSPSSSLYSLRSHWASSWRGFFQSIVFRCLATRFP